MHAPTHFFPVYLLVTQGTDVFHADLAGAVGTEKLAINGVNTLTGIYFLSLCFLLFHHLPPFTVYRSAYPLRMASL